VRNPLSENRKACGSVLGQFFRTRGVDFRAVLAGLFMGGLIQLPLHALGFLHFAFFQALHFFLALLKCCCQGFSSLPAGFARLARRFAVILVRKAVPAAALAALIVAAAESAALAERLGASRWSAFALGPRFVHLEVASA
jgi:hypothetical protein